MAHGQAGAEIATDRTPTLTCNHKAPIAFHPTQDPISSTNVCHSLGANSNATAAVAVGTDCYNGNLTGDIAATMGTPGSSINASGPTVMVPIAWDEELNSSIDQAGTLLRGGDGGRHDGVMAFQVGPKSGEFTDIAPTMDCRAKNGPIQNQLGAGVLQAMQVRRLTPVECERLQGFPDNYTRIPWKFGYWPADKHSPEVLETIAGQCPDGPRYKALGNSMAVPVMRWIGQRIEKVENP